MIIENYKSMNKGTLVAFFDLVVPAWGNFFIKGCRLFQKDGRRWIGYPSDCVEKDGEKNYYAKNGFKEKEISFAFQEKVLKAIDEHAKTMSQPDDVDELPF